MELAGTDASKYEKKKQSKMPLLTIILIAVAGAVGLFLMLLACCCVSYILPSFSRPAPFKSSIFTGSL